MALNFPTNPVDGQLYPDPAIPGAQQYIWSSEKATWLTVFKGISSITAVNPLYTAGSAQTPVIGIFPATQTEGGYMSAQDKTKLDNLPDNAGTVSKITAGPGIGAPNAGESITTEGTINLLPATPSTIGGIRSGPGTTVNETGLLSLAPPSGQALGGVKQGNGLSISTDGVISIAPSGTFTVLDPIGPFNGVNTTFSLTVRNNPFSPSSINALLIFMGGVFQIPNISYSVSPGLITFTEAPPAGVSFYGISLT